jgi:protein-disulfide isomerase
MVEAVPVPPAQQPVANVSRTALYVGITAVFFFLAGYGIAWLSINAALGDQQAAFQSTVQSAVAEALANVDLGSAVAAAEPEPTPSIYDVSVDDDPSIGPENAPIVMVEFSDFRCPYCARFNAQTLEPLLAQYEGQIKFVYRDFPVVGGDRAALAAECADDQGVFWEYHDLLFENQASLNTDDSLIQLASQLNIDMDTFSTCLSTDEHSDEIENDFSQGLSYGVGGTPAFFINGRPIVGAQPIAAFQQVIDDELAAQAAAG